MKALLFVAFAMLGAGCGDCVPKDVNTAASFSLGAPAKEPLALAHSADELRAFVEGVSIASPPQSSGRAPMDPAERAKAEKAELDAFVAQTSFTTSDIAIVRAGGGHRMQFVGTTTNGAVVTLYFRGGCSPCSGGDPNSSENAALAYEFARLDRMELVRVSKNARIEIRECSVSCGGCPTNVP